MNLFSVCGPDEEGFLYCPAGKDHLGAKVRKAYKSNLERHMEGCKKLKALRATIDDTQVQAACDQYKAKAESLEGLLATREEQIQDLILTNKGLREEVKDLKESGSRVTNNNIQVNIVNLNINTAYPFGEERWDSLPSFDNVQKMLIPPEDSISKLVLAKLQNPKTNNVRMQDGMLEWLEGTDKGPTWEKQPNQHGLHEIVMQNYQQLGNIYGADKCPQWKAWENGGLDQSTLQGQMSRVKSALQGDEASGSEEGVEEGADMSEAEEAEESPPKKFKCGKCGGYKMAPSAKCQKTCPRD